MFNKKIYIERRKKLSNEMKKGIGIFMGNGDSPASYADNCYEFIQDSTFLYYFGINRAGLVGIIDFLTGESYISGKDFSLEDMIWMGEQPTLNDEAKKYGINKYINYSKIEDFIIDKSEGTDEDDEEYYQEILYVTPYRSDRALELARILEVDYNELEDYSSVKLAKAIINQRNKKGKEEIEELEKAAYITCLMQKRAFEIIRPGIYEYEVRAEVEAIAYKHNCTPSFQTICTINGETLHNHNYKNILKEGDILVLDCGARLSSGYCGDMTRAIPVSGKFSARQKEVYEILLEMYEAAVSSLKIGVEFRVAYEEASRKLIDGMKKLNLMKGDTEEILNKGAHALFFPHGLGHMLGMDVHDMENLGENFVGYEEGEQRDKRYGHKALRLARKLRDGYVFTVEPGIYFIPGLIANWKSKSLFKEFLNYEEIEKYIGFGGMRYESDYLITEEKLKKLGIDIPKTVNEIESAMEK